MGFCGKTSNFCKIGKGGKFAVECVSIGIWYYASKKIFFALIMMFFGIKLERRYISAIPQNGQLYIIRDASLEAMCIVAHFRAAETDAGNEVSFVIGKCKIAPIKQLSIPRLRYNQFD